MHLKGLINCINYIFLNNYTINLAKKQSIVYLTKLANLQCVYWKVIILSPNARAFLR